MASWDELRTYIRVSYKVAEDDGELLKLVFSTTEGRSQMVLVARSVTGNGLEFATIASPIGRAAGLDLTAVLTELATYVVGGAAVYGDRLMVRHSVPLTNLDTNEFDGPLHLVLAAADVLESQFVGGDEF